MASAITVAQAFLDLAHREEKSLSNMQLQKLVFFAHGIHLGAFDGEALIDETVKAWDFGPVIPELYEKLRVFGRGKVTTDLAPQMRDFFSDDGTEMEAIRTTWDAYKDKAAWQLSNISHVKGSPWDQVWNCDQNRYANIPNKLIQDYYQRHLRVEPAQ
jgi:uncharacterized phage-associated protein